MSHSDRHTYDTSGLEHAVVGQGVDDVELEAVSL